MTLKQKLFVDKYIQFSSATEAALQVYNTKKRNVAAQIGYENLRKPYIKEAIQSYFEHKMRLPVYAVKSLANTMRNGTINQQISASITYFKIMGLYPCPHNSNN